MKNVLVVASLTPHPLQASQPTSPTGRADSPLVSKTLLEPFNYDGVHLLDGMLKKQYSMGRDYFFDIPDDDNTLSSAAMTYAVTREPDYLKIIVNAYDWLEQTQCYVTGGYGPDERLLPADGSLGSYLETTMKSFDLKV